MAGSKTSSQVVRSVSGLTDQNNRLRRLLECASADFKTVAAKSADGNLRSLAESAASNIDAELKKA